MNPLKNSFTTTVRRFSSAPLVLTLAVACGLTGCSAGLEPRFQAHIDYLAGDALRGRGVGTPGIEQAAEYIAHEFASIGLQPVGDNATYFQSFPITLRRTLTDMGRLARKGTAGGWLQGRDYIPFSFSSDDAFQGDVVFCGYGIVAPDKQHDDFVHIDLDGKVALIFRGEPPSWGDADGNPTSASWFRNKVYNVKDRGALAVLIVNQTPAAGETDKLAEFESEGADAYGIPAIHVTRPVAESLLMDGKAGTLVEVQQKLDAGQFASAPLPKVRVSGQAAFEQISAPTRNVLGLMRGQGPYADETIVLGAHYDHLGFVKPMMRKFKGGKRVADDVAPQIHNGADDNASGVSGLIEIARVFAAGPPPPRTLLFIAFTAEESGLHGSKYYLEHPVVPVEQTIAMLNMDMIGRMPPSARSVQVFGVSSAGEFKDALQSAGRAVGLRIAPSPDDGGRSDHATFLRKHVPSLHFFTGQHADYHKPSDDSDKINAVGGAKVASLVYRTAKALSALPQRPAWQDAGSTSAAASGPLPSYRVVMGLAPGYGDDGKPGMAVEAVSPEGPADLAGMKAGDRIVRINDKKVANVYDYMAATRGNNPGDAVEVVVLRGNHELTLRVTLSGAK